MARTPNWKRPGSPIGRKGPRKANPKYKRRMREPWTDEDLKELKALAKQNTPTGVLSLKLQRPPAAIRSKAQREGISLKPTNRSPYTRSKSTGRKSKSTATKSTGRKSSTRKSTARKSTGRKSTGRKTARSGRKTGSSRGRKSA